MITTYDQLRELIAELSEVTEFAVDLEVIKKMSLITIFLLCCVV